MQQKRTVLLSSPHLDENDFKLVHDALASGRLASGPVVETFEREMAERYGAAFAIAASSGTAALHMGMIAAGVQDGDLVITSPFSFVASANVILYERGVPLFVDVERETMALDPQKVVEAIDAIANQRSGWQALVPPAVRHKPAVLRAVLPVHVFGRPTEMAGIMSACRAAGLRVIEDACEAFDASIDGLPAGRWGDAGALAFYPNKQLTTGEGGMLLTDNAEWADLFRSLRNQGRSTDERWFRHDRLGFNYRMDEMSGALGLSQLRRADDLLRRRQEIADRYHSHLHGVAGVSTLPPVRAGLTQSWFLYTIRLDPHIDRDAFMARLSVRGIMTRPYFWPIHLQPFYIERFGFAPGDFPESEAAAASMLSLPMPLATGVSDVDYVCEVIREELGRR
jgi:perosamine synthetase